MIDFGTLAQWASAGLAVCALLYTIVSGRSKARADKVSRIAVAVDVLETRCTKIEGELGHLPSTESIHRLELATSELKGQLNVIAERVEPIASIARRLQEFLMENGRS